jgi:O-antigen/teichoic acid export membrane protein
MASPLRILFSGAGLALVRLLTGLVRSKWIAITFGPPGVGLVAQATQFQLVANSAASFSTVAAIIQGSKGDYRKRSEELFRCAFLMILVGFTVMLAGVAIVGPGSLGHWMFGTGFGAVDFVLVLLSMPFTLASTCFLEAAFFIHDRFDRYVAASGAHALLQSVFFVGFSWWLGIRGLLLAVPVSSLALALLFAGDLFRIRVLDFRWFLPKWNRELAVYLARHGMVMFLSSVGGGFLLLFVRSSLVDHIGLESNGVLQVPIALSAYGSAIMTNFLWGRVHPAFSSGEVADSFELSLCSITAFCVAVGTWVVAPVVVPAVYSRNFSPAVPLLSIQCVGDVFHYSFMAYSIALLASGRWYSYLFGWVAYYFPFVLMLLAPDYLNPSGYVGLHLAGSVLALAVMAFVSFRKGFVARRYQIQFVLFAVLLGGLSAAVMNLLPPSTFARWTGGLSALLTGLLFWRILYGEAVNRIVNSILHRLRAIRLV